MFGRGAKVWVLAIIVLAGWSNCLMCVQKNISEVFLQSVTCSLRIGKFRIKNSQFKRLIFFSYYFTTETSNPQNRNNKVKKEIWKCWDSNPYLLLQHHVVLSTVLWEISDFTGNIKMYGRADIRTRAYCLRNFCPYLSADTIYLFKKITRILRKKKKNDPAEWILTYSKILK